MPIVSRGISMDAQNIEHRATSSCIRASAVSEAQKRSHAAVQRIDDDRCNCGCRAQKIQTRHICYKLDIKDQAVDGRIWRATTPPSRSRWVLPDTPERLPQRLGFPAGILLRFRTRTERFTLSLLSAFAYFFHSTPQRGDMYRNCFVSQGFAGKCSAPAKHRTASAWCRCRGARGASWAPCFRNRCAPRRTARETRLGRLAAMFPSEDAGENVFEKHIGRPLFHENPTTLQINIGLTCNMACSHCHVESSPNRRETMSFEVADRILELLRNSWFIETVDITGGAPEMHDAFRYLIRQIRTHIPHVRTIYDRCNLTILRQIEQYDLVEFLKRHQVDIIASLPCYVEENVDRQRGNTAYRRSIAALLELNRAGYGLPNSPHHLHLVYNPLGPYLPPNQLGLEIQYHEYLYRNFGIFFNRLICITNMPIKRFLDDLCRTGYYEAYMELLVNSCNLAAVDGVMCLDQIHVSYDGTLHDCDFNYALEMPVCWGHPDDPGPQTIFDLQRSFDEVAGKRIRTGVHCFGCTAGNGSSCTGAIVT